MAYQLRYRKVELSTGRNPKMRHGSDLLVDAQWLQPFCLYCQQYLLGDSLSCAHSTCNALELFIVQVNWPNRKEKCSSTPWSIKFFPLTMCVDKRFRRVCAKNSHRPWIVFFFKCSHLCSCMLHTNTHGTKLLEVAIHGVVKMWVVYLALFFVDHIRYIACT